MADETWQDPNKSPSDQEVAIDYIKADGFKIVWADGVIGGITPRGHIHCALYAERQAIPRRQVYGIVKTVGNQGQLGTEVLEKRVSRGSIVREMSCDVMLSVEAAESMAKWLLERVREVKEPIGATDGAGTPNPNSK